MGKTVGVGWGGFYGWPKSPTGVLVASSLLEVAVNSVGPSSKDPVVFLSHSYIKGKSHLSNRSASHHNRTGRRPGFFSQQ